MISGRRGGRHRLGKAPRVVVVSLVAACGAAQAQPIHHNLHNPSESCFEYVVAAALCALIGGLVHEWLLKGGKESKGKDRP